MRARIRGHRSTGGFALLSNILADIRYTVRGLASRPTFAVVVMLTLALGVGVNVAMFLAFSADFAAPAAGAGVLIGVPAAYVVGPYLESLLFGLEPRAARVNPLTTLRDE